MGTPLAADESETMASLTVQLAPFLQRFISILINLASEAFRLSGCETVQTIF